MENQIYLNILISLILSTSISYFYLRKINVKFLIYVITIFLISFTIFYLLGPQNNSIESFNNIEEEDENNEGFYKYLGNWKFTNFSDNYLDTNYNYYISFVKLPKEDLKAVITKVKGDENPYSDPNNTCPNGVAVCELKLIDINENTKDFYYLSNVICSKDSKNNSQEEEEENTFNGLKVFKNLEPISQLLTGSLPNKDPFIYGIRLEGLTGSYERLNGKVTFVQQGKKDENNWGFDLLEKIDDFKYESGVMNLLNKINQKSKSNLYESVDNIQEEVFDDIKDELETDEEFMKMPSEEDNQEEELNQQEEHIRKSIEEEPEEEKEEKPKRKPLENNNFLRKIFSGNNNQINPGIGIGVSPVNIYINGDKTSVDKFGNNNKGKTNPSNQPQNNDCSKCNNNDNYFKKASRIHNNSDWIYDKPQWCSNDSNNEKYNYDKDDYLLPNSETKKKINKIPQTLSESVNSKKPKNNSEPCPLDINKSWSNYKTGDDKESGEILPEGFNL